ncbi:MAG: hypothetical protein NTV97_10250 [Alphaproteobacteria bacterium]|nr:hypothetical protein [Alphaproteobacteria bacterium]
MGRLLATIGVTLLVVAAVNIVVDPFQVWRIVKVAGLDMVKVPETNWDVVTKIYGIRWIKPRAIILGSSRARMALDPQRIDWRDGVEPSFNAGVPLGSMRDIRSLFDLAVRTAPVKVALVELEFHSFDVNSFDLDNNLKRKDSRLRLRGLPDLLPGLLLMDGLGQSWAILKRYLDMVAHPFFHERRDGKLEFHAEVFHAPLANDGHERLFLKQWLNADPALGFCLRRADGRESGLAELGALLDQAREQGVKVILVLAPSHARRLELIWAAGLRPQFERWKRELVRSVSVHQRDSRSPGVVLWDFTHYSHLTTEEFRLVVGGRSQTTTSGSLSTSRIGSA